MIVISNVYQGVVDTLKTDGIIHARLERPAKGTNPYAILSELSNMENFFFGAVGTEFNNDICEMLEESNLENSQLIIMDIPEEELFFTDYHAYCDYLNAHFLATFDDGDLLQIKENHKGKLLGTPDECPCQANFAYIKEEWVITIKPTVDFTYIGECEEELLEMESAISAHLSN